MLERTVGDRPAARHVQVEALQSEQREEEERLPAAEQAGQSRGRAGLFLGPHEDVGIDVGIEALGVGVGVVTGVLVLPPAVPHPDQCPGGPPGHLAGAAAAEHLPVGHVMGDQGHLPVEDRHEDGDHQRPPRGPDERERGPADGVEARHRGDPCRVVAGTASQQSGFRDLPGQPGEVAAVAVGGRSDGRDGGHDDGTLCEVGGRLGASAGVGGAAQDEAGLQTLPLAAGAGRYVPAEVMREAAASSGVSGGTTSRSQRPRPGEIRTMVSGACGAVVLFRRTTGVATSMRPGATDHAVEFTVTPVMSPHAVGSAAAAAGAVSGGRVNAATTLRRCGAAASRGARGADEAGDGCRGDCRGRMGGDHMGSL
ncbi:hypothetical protein STENM223S_02291 [Streptomyces tendae]